MPTISSDWVLTNSLLSRALSSPPNTRWSSCFGPGLALLVVMPQTLLRESVELTVVRRRAQQCKWRPHLGYAPLTAYFAGDVNLAAAAVCFSTAREWRVAHPAPSNRATAMSATSPANSSQ